MNICIDSGHHPPVDLGAIYNEHIEYIHNRRIATEVQSELIRKKHIVFPFCGSLNYKCEQVNRSMCDVAVEIHHNANDDKQVRGAEVLYYPDSQEGKTLAGYILESIKMSFLARGIYNGYIRRDQNKGILAFLGGTNMPAVIVECLYLTNSYDRAELARDFYVERMAKRIVEGIERYIRR